MTLFPRVAAGGALVLSLVLTACADSDTGTPGSPAPEAAETTSTGAPTTPGAVTDEHNDADVAFAQNMIVHHRGALQMAELAATRAVSPEVTALAERIRAAQQPEIDTMTSWLQEWGAPVPEASAGGMHGAGTPGGMAGGAMPTPGGEMPTPGMEPGMTPGMGHGGGGDGMGAGDVPGMMTDEQTDALQGARGMDFDQMFLQMMTVHHRDAIEMAEAEQENGQNPAAVELAGTIVADQTREIEEMEQLLESL